MFFFYSYIVFIYILQICLAIFLYPFIFLSKFLKKRYLFEKDKDRNERTDLAFEVASEGELEQVFPLIEYFCRDKKVKLIYSSESLQDRLSKLKIPNLKLTPLPILRLFPLFKINAPLLIMCRYDFYPNLLLHGIKNRIFLVSASLKNKSINIRSKYLYKSFDLIIPVNETEKRNFERYNFKTGNFFDFRILQIVKRLENAPKKLEPFLELKEILTERSLIMGSAWIEDLIILNKTFLQNVKKDKVVIVPHKLDHSNLDAIIKDLKSKTKELDLKISLFTDGLGDITIINIKGVLLELYSYFNHAYVGGGFSKSIHSLLEPYLANNIIYLGPNHHRSTEFDLIKESSPDQIKVVDQNFKLIFPTIDYQKRSSIINRHKKDMNLIVKEIEASILHAKKRN